MHSAKDMSDTPSGSTACELDNGPMGKVPKSKFPEKSSEQDPSPQAPVSSRGSEAKSLLPSSMLSTWPASIGSWMAGDS